MNTKFRNILIGFSTLFIVFGIVLGANAALLSPNKPGGLLQNVNLNGLVMTLAGPFTVSGTATSTITGDGTTSTLGGALVGTSATFANAILTSRLSVGTTTASDTLLINGGIKLTSGSSSVVTPAIGGAIVSGGCDSATSTIDSSLSTSTTAFITTPSANPGTTVGGTWVYSYILSPGILITNVCANITVTPNTIPYVVKIIR